MPTTNAPLAIEEVSTSSMACAPCLPYVPYLLESESSEVDASPSLYGTNEDLPDAEKVQVLVQQFDDALTVKKDRGTRPTNKPDVVRKSFIKYLRHEFSHLEPWQHPITGHVFPHSLIKEKLNQYKKESDPGYYRALWALITTQATRAFIADNFNFSGSSIKRRWNDSIDTIMLMLLFPELRPELPVILYQTI